MGQSDTRFWYCRKAPLSFANVVDAQARSFFADTRCFAINGVDCRNTGEVNGGITAYGNLDGQTSFSLTICQILSSDRTRIGE